MMSETPALGAAVAAAVVGAAIIAWLGTGAMLCLARRWGLLAPPSAHSMHGEPSPTAGGMGVLCGFWGGAVLLLAMGFTVFLWQPLLATSVVLLTVGADDLVRPLKVILRSVSGRQTQWSGKYDPTHS